MNKLLTILVGASLCFGAAMLMPFAGGDSGMSPIPTAWAAPVCTDADNDGYFKFHRKGCPEGNDPNDSDCNIVPVGEEVPSTCTGTGTGGDLGSAISMDCILVGDWGDASGETIKGDKLVPVTDPVDGAMYSDAVDKVNCSIEGPSTPWPIRLGVGVKGNGANSVRKVDIALGTFETPTALISALSEEQQGQLGTAVDLDDYPNLFASALEDDFIAGYPDMKEMDLIRLGVRPYRDDPDQTADGIHLLTPGKVYEMGMKFSIPGTEHFNFSIAGQHYPGNESFTGINCETGFEGEILAHAPALDVATLGNVDDDGVGMRDVSVYLWLDGDDADNLPDGYTVSTGKITPPGGPGRPTDISTARRYAAVCSAVGPAVCGNPHAPSVCNFLGYVPVQFTMHAEVK